MEMDNIKKRLMRTYSYGKSKPAANRDEKIYLQTLEELKEDIGNEFGEIMQVINEKETLHQETLQLIYKGLTALNDQEEAPQSREEMDNRELLRRIAVLKEQLDEQIQREQIKGTKEIIEELNLLEVKVTEKIRGINTMVMVNTCLSLVIIAVIVLQIMGVI